MIIPQQDTLTWLHLSDLLFKESEKSMEHKVTLLTDIKNFTNEANLIPDLVFVTGDIAFTASREEYKSAVTFLFDKLIDITGVDKTHIFFVPGNHDIHLRPMKKHDTLAPGNFESDISRFYRYNEFIDRYFSPSQALDENTLYYCENLKVNGHRLSIWGLNTVAGINLTRQYPSIQPPEPYSIERSISQNRGELQIVLLHNPYQEVISNSFFRVFDPVFSRSHFLLHGHSETPSAPRILPTSQAVVIDGGSYRSKELHPNMYNIVQLNFNDQSGKIFFRGLAEYYDSWQIDQRIVNGGTYGFNFFPSRVGTGNGGVVSGIPPVQQDISQTATGDGETFIGTGTGEAITGTGDGETITGTGTGTGDGETFTGTGTGEVITGTGDGLEPFKPGDGKQPLAHLADDRAEGKDQLDITADVNAFSSIIAAESTKPPLCLGLFGDWGSGKTFFMKKLEERIKLLAKRSEKAKEEGNATHYHSNIVQIWFNAWHYMDSNLWASMVNRIFEGLSEYLEKKELKEQQAKLFQELHTAKKMIEEAEQAKSRAEQEIEQVKTKLKEIQDERINKSVDLDKCRKEIFEKFLEDKNTKKAIENLKNSAKQMGFSKIMESAEQLAEIPGYIQQLTNRSTGFLQAFLHAPHRWLRFGILLILMIGVPLLPVILKGLNQLLFGNKEVLTAFSSAISQVTTFILGIAGAIRHGTKKAEEGLKKLESSYAEVDKIMALSHPAPGEEEVKLQIALADLQEKENAIIKMLAEANERRNKAEADLIALQNIRDSKPLGEFIRERAASEEYRKHLGLISVIRKDLESLSEKLNPQQKENPPVEGLPSIDRIVLYIDDLDRCPEERVVDVLQAVHLLLFFPLFVVVVGVDSRWILRSLEKSYHPLQKSGNENVEEEEAAAWVWESTPQNYLEKIFHVPYHLPRVDRKGFENFVDSIMGPSNLYFSLIPPGEQANQPDSTNQPTTPGNIPDNGTEIKKKETVLKTDNKDKTGDKEENEAAPVKQEEPGPPTTGSDEQITEETGSILVIENEEPEDEEPVDLMPKSLDITDDERKFAYKLEHLIHTPRSLKRFLNIYRIIKSRVALKEDVDISPDNFVTAGHYQIVMVLLAILTGFPRQAILLFSKIKNATSNRKWTDLIAGLEPQKSGEDNYANDFDKTINRVEMEIWTYLFEALEDLNKKIQLPEEVGSYKEWARKVGRFSYRGGKIMEYSPLDAPSSPQMVTGQPQGLSPVKEKKTGRKKAK